MVIHSKNVIFVLVISVFANSSYAEIYKWEDKDGKVHYSEKKPEENNGQKIDNVSNLNTSGSSSSYAPLKYVAKKDHYYCGDERVHRLDSEERLLSYANSSLDRYKRDLQSKKESLSRYQSQKRPVTSLKYANLNRIKDQNKRLKENKERLQEGIKILECKIGWAETIIHKIEDLYTNIYRELDAAYNDEKAAVIKRNDTCGYNAPDKNKYKNSSEYKMDSEAYRDCYNKHTKIVDGKLEEIEYLENMLKRLNNKKKNTRKYKTY